MSKIKDYAKDLNNSIDFSRYIGLVEYIGTSLNAPKDRFDKADIIEGSLEVYSNDRLKWIDEEGRDHLDTENGNHIEFKYLTDGLYTKKSGNLKPFTSSYKIKNSLGKNKGVTLENNADYYILAQQDAMAIIDYENIKKYLRATGDGIEAKIPSDSLTFIFPKTNKDGKNNSVRVNYKEEKRKMQRMIIENI